MQLNPTREDKTVDMFIDKSAVKKMLKHCRDFRDARLEVMGFMLGHKYSWGGKDYTVVEEVLTSDLDTSSVSVKFASFEPLFQELDRLEKEGKDYILVGWYHSHPGHTSFMSPTDVNTQRQMFSKEYQSAIVIDPISIEMKAFALQNNEVYEKPYAILDTEAGAPDDEDIYEAEMVEEELVEAEMVDELTSKPGRKPSYKEPLNPILDTREVDLFIRKKAAEKMLEHCREYRDSQLEVMGFMVGHRFAWGGSEFTVVEDVVTSELDASAVSVKFASFDGVFSELDRMEKQGKDYILVGWYHSHPGHTSFMSPTDIDTQRQMFKKKYQSAIVIDPINIEMKAFTLRGEDVYEKPFAVLWGEDDAPAMDAPDDIYDVFEDDSILDADILEEKTRGELTDEWKEEWQTEELPPAEPEIEFEAGEEEEDEDVLFDPILDDELYDDIENTEGPEEHDDKLGILDYSMIAAPVLFGVLGGAFGYIFEKDKSRSYSYFLLIAGIILSIFWYSMSYVIY